MISNIPPISEAKDSGYLRIYVRSSITTQPIEHARIRISYTGIPDSILEEQETDSSGSTSLIKLPAPPFDYSTQPSSEYQPYSEYTLDIDADGYISRTIAGTEIFPAITSFQYVYLDPVDASNTSSVETYVIPAHTLYGNYPSKIPESETKPITESGEIVLSRVVIPEYIVVHDGSPRDSTAKNYYVKYKDYIKNVASSEIYATWPTNTIRANILAIMSFTLNRVYTEWYRNQGYDFTITSSTAFDHKWIPERNYYETITQIVDELFSNYLSRPNIKQPILTQYCDGNRVHCPNWMSQWGSKALGDKGYSTIEILRYYYGEDLYINIAEGISGIPASWPGYNLEQGSRGKKVLQLQEELNGISRAYPALPSIETDGIYGPATQNAVRIFQSIFGLPVTGITDFKTWYKISEVYVGVSRIAELQ